MMAIFPGAIAIGTGIGPPPTGGMYPAMWLGMCAAIGGYTCIAGGATIDCGIGGGTSSKLTPPTLGAEGKWPA